MIGHARGVHGSSVIYRGAFSGPCTCARLTEDLLRSRLARHTCQRKPRRIAGGLSEVGRLSAESLLQDGADVTVCREVYNTLPVSTQRIQSVDVIYGRDSNIPHSRRGLTPIVGVCNVRPVFKVLLLKYIAFCQNVYQGTTSFYTPESLHNMPTCS